MEGRPDEHLPLCCCGMTEHSGTLGTSGSPADGVCLLFSYTVRTPVGPMGEFLGGHGGLESWSELRLLDLAIDFLNCDTKAKERI